MFSYHAVSYSQCLGANKQITVGFCGESDKVSSEEVVVHRKVRPRGFGLGFQPAVDPRRILHGVELEPQLRDLAHLLDAEGVEGDGVWGVVHSCDGNAITAIEIEGRVRIHDGNGGGRMVWRGGTRGIKRGDGTY